MNRLLRRLPLVVVLGMLAWLFLGERPRPIELVYDIPDDPPPTRVEVTIRDAKGRVAGSLRWGTGKGAATDRQPHDARLANGTFLLEATLEYGDGARRELARELSVGPSDERIVLHLRWVEAQAQVDGEEAGLAAALERVAHATEAEAKAVVAEAEIAGKLQPLRDQEAAKGAILHRFKVEQENLEDHFLRLVGASA